MWKVGVLLRYVRFLPCWQTAHPFTKFTIQVFIPGHQKLQAIWHVVSSLPGCPAIGESWYRRTMSVLIGGVGVGPFFPVRTTMSSMSGHPYYFSLLGSISFSIFGSVVGTSAGLV